MLKGLYCLFLEVSGEVLVEHLEEGLGSLVAPDFFNGIHYFCYFCGEFLDAEEEFGAGRVKGADTEGDGC